MNGNAVLRYLLTIKQENRNKYEIFLKRYMFR